MPRYVDEDVIRNKPVSKEYRDNWDRVFGDPEPERFVEIKHFCKECDALVPDPENHRHEPAPNRQAVSEYLNAGGQPSPIGWYGVFNVDGEDPLYNMDLGQQCPVCASENRIVTVIDLDERVTQCERYAPVFVPGDTPRRHEWSKPAA